MGFVQSPACIFKILYLRSTNIALYKIYEEEIKLCLTKRLQTCTIFGVNEPWLV